jgi:DNA-binding beta-propeller fold protein YncE
MLCVLILALSGNATIEADISRGDRHDFVKIKGNIVFMNQPALQVGGFGDGKNQLGGADTVAVDQWGNLYVVDDLQNLIKVWSYYTLTGEILEIISSSSIERAGLAPLAEIRAISAGNPRVPAEATRLYILDRSKHRDPEFRILMRPHLFSNAWVQLPHTDFKKTPHDLTVDIFGRLIVSEKKGKLEVLLPDGSGRDKGFGDKGILDLEDIDGLDAMSLKSVDTDRYGNIYVADNDHGRIIKIDSNGIILRTFGSRGDGADQFREEVEGIAIDWRGNVYGRDEAADSYLVFDSDGTFITRFGKRGFEPDQQENADEFVIDRRHRRFIIADNNNYRVSVHNLKRRSFLSRVFTQHDLPTFPVVEPVWVGGGERGNMPGIQFDEPNELSFDNNGNLWAGDIFNFRVQIYDSHGQFLTTVGGEGNGDCEFVNPLIGKSGPEAIQSDSGNRVYVVDRGGQKINIYDGSNYSCIGMIQSELFEDPTGLVIDSRDQLYVADQGTDMIYQFSKDEFTHRYAYKRTFQKEVDGDSILKKTETLALDEKYDRLYASSEDESRVEVFGLASGKYIGKHIGELQVGVIPQNGRFVDDVEGLASDTINGWLVMSDEDNGRFMIHDLNSGELFNSELDYAYLASFGRLGSAPGEFLSADGVAFSNVTGLVGIADQGNYRIQVFRISDLKSKLLLE